MLRCVEGGKKVFLSHGTGDLFKDVMCVEGEKKQGKGEREEKKKRKREA